MTPRHMILDRDGVLNEEAPDGGYVSSPSMWRWLPGALTALARLTAAGVRISVATNQSGVGRGLMSIEDLEAVHERMLHEARANSASISAVYVCPHAPSEACACRKPGPELIRRAVAESGVLADDTLVVGDAGRDLEAARAAGVPAALVLTGKGRLTARTIGANIEVYDDLQALAANVVAAVPEEERGQ